MSSKQHKRAYHKRSKVIAVPVVHTEAGPRVLVVRHRQSGDYTFVGGGWRATETLEAAMARELDEEAGVGPHDAISKAVGKGKFSTVWFTNKYRPQHAVSDRRDGGDVVELYCGAIFAMDATHIAAGPRDDEVSTLHLMSANDLVRYRPRFWAVMVQCGVVDYVARTLMRARYEGGYSGNAKSILGLQARQALRLALPTNRIQLVQGDVLKML